MNPILVGGAIRWALAVGGTYLVTKGVLTAETVTELSKPEVVGGLAAIGSLAWSLWIKHKT